MFRGTVIKAWKDEKGAVAATYAIALMGLIAIAGVAFDYGRLAAMDSELQNGADQAALAGASQLDGKDAVGAVPSSCDRAIAAARNLLLNKTVLANDGLGNAVTLDTTESGCDATGMFRFYTTADGTTAATTNATAKFFEVSVNLRTARYALTPVVGAFSSGGIGAQARAGVGSSICKVPPLMICSPDPGASFNAAGKKGWGLMATGHGGGNNTWSPGNFGFLEVGNAQKSDLEKALAFKELPIDCTPLEGTRPETGNAQGLYRAINTRFDIYDTNGSTLDTCMTGQNCPAASNVVKDLVKQNSNNTGNPNICKTTNNNQGWHLPAGSGATGPFSPAAGNLLTETNTTVFDTDGQSAMGLTRDLCHYDSYRNGRSNYECNQLSGLGSIKDPDSRFGNGRWARRDFFNKYHSAATWPPNVGSQYLMNTGDNTSFTRFGMYKWEIAQANIPFNTPGSGNDRQFGSPVCGAASTGGLDRRVLTLAVVKNCASLTGGSTPVVVDEWIDAFFVEPVFDGRGNGASNDMIYMEIIGPAAIGGGGAEALSQTIRRDVPYLVR